MCDPIEQCRFGLYTSGDATDNGLRIAWDASARGKGTNRLARNERDRQAAFGLCSSTGEQRVLRLAAGSEPFDCAAGPATLERFERSLRLR